VDFEPFLAGIARLTLAVAPLAMAAVAARARLLPTWRGAIARVAELVLVLSALTVIAEILGIAGVFERWVLVPISAAIGLGATLLLRRGAPRAHHADVQPCTRPSRLGGAVAGAAVILLALQWLAPSLAALRHGMQGSVDTLWYHGPTAARFVQQGNVTSIHYFDDNALTAFFPGGSSLLHATGIAAVGNDVLSPLVNLLFLALAVTAAWCVGARWRNGPAAVLAAVAVLGTPTLVTTQPGGDYSDIVAMALVLAAVALLLAGNGRGVPLALAAVAAGLAIGAKLTMIPPVGALTIGVLVVNRRRWRPTAAWWVGGLAAVSAVWYVRNTVAAQSPLPGPGVTLGPLRLHRLPSTTPIETVARYLGNGHIVGSVLVPGLDAALGTAWVAILFGGLAGGILVAWHAKEPLARMIGAVSVASFVAFLVTPQYLGTPRVPYFFAVNVRYSLTALALGLVMLPALPRLQSNRGRALVVGLLAAVVALTQVRASDLWSAPLADTLLAAAVLAVAVAGWTVRRRLPEPGRAAVAALCVLAAIGGTWFVQRHVVSTRYTTAYFRQPVLAALVHRHAVRVATEGFYLQYALYGPDLANYVQYVAQRRSHGGYAPFTACRPWAATINAGHYDYLLVASASYPITSKHPRELDWAHAEWHALRQIASDGSRAATFRVVRPLDLGACPT
jgi:4-amino-4-deoxy-L-arabinose transferase-like glycosyltransferase